MFIYKEFGHSRRALFERHFDMYKLGIACLLHCHSIKDIWSSVLCKRQNMLNISESDFISESLIDYELLYQMDHLLND